MFATRLFFPLLTLIIAQGTAASAQPPAERTLSYAATITGQDNGSLSVKEIFQLVSTGDGITTVPARYLQQDFPDSPSLGILVKRVLHDGQPVVFEIGTTNEFCVLYFGRRDEPLRPGTHTFQAEYELDRYTADTNGETTLMWKAAPDSWPMQIDKVCVNLQLPPSILSAFVKFYGFTGFPESEEQDLRIKRNHDNSATFTSRHPVCKGERFDAIAAWETPVARSERILRFNSDITLSADGSVDVHEAISALALGQNITHGIERYVLRRDRGFLGLWQYFTYNAGETTIDGRFVPVEQSVDESGDFTVLRIGNKRESVFPGERVFDLSFRTKDQFLRLPDGDRFYWNVAGSGTKNAFPINQVIASITLPPGACASNITWRAWTGKTGSTNGTYDAWFDQQGRLMFVARNFACDEAFTVQLDLPAGIVARPTTAHTAWQVVRDNAQLVPAAGGFLAMALYLLIVWFKHGRDPAKGIIIPLYEAPDGLSPGQVRHVMRMSYDDRCFSADILDLAARGLVAIKTDGKRYLLKRNRNPAEVIPVDEAEAFGRLFAAGDDVAIGEAGYKSLVSARETIRRAIDRTCDPYFFANGSYAACGLMISFFTLFLAVFLAPAGHKAMGLLWTVLMIPVTILTVWLVFVAFRKWMYFITGFVPRASGIALALLATLLACGAAWLEWQLIGYTAGDTSLPMAAILAATVFLNYVSWDIMRAPSKKGRQLMDQIEGFRMYLEIGEKDIMEHATKIGVDVGTLPVRTVELYEKHLPYALALDVENKWAGKFADLLAKAHVDHELKPGVVAMSSAMNILSRGLPDIHKLLEEPVTMGTGRAAAGSSRTAWGVASLVAGTVVCGFAGGGRGGGGVGGW